MLGRHSAWSFISVRRQVTCIQQRTGGVHGGRTYIHGAAKGTGGWQRVWRDVGSRIPVKSYDVSTQEVGGYTAVIEHTGHRDWNLELQDLLPGKGRTAEISIDRVPGQSGDEDGNTGALRALAYP